MRVLFGIALALIALVIISTAISGTRSGTSDDRSAQTNLHTASSSCAVTDFSLSRTQAHVEYDYAKLTGIVTNNCKYAAGVQLKWTAFNSDGTVAFSEDFWPASTTNIPPGTDYPFEMMDTAPRGKWTYEVDPIALKVW
jgi:hypothetical protein